MKNTFFYKKNAHNPPKEKKAAEQYNLGLFCFADL